MDPSLFSQIRGSTDSELLFHLALTLGLQDDPVTGLERPIGFVEETARRLGIPDPVQASIGVSDGNRLWAIRYAHGGARARSSHPPTRRRSAACIRRASACSGSVTRIGRGVGAAHRPARAVGRTRSPSQAP